MAKQWTARVLGDRKLVEWIGPALMLLVCVFCFGILLSRLGFFQDDWHHVFFSYWQGTEGLQRFLLKDRGPFAWPVYAGFFKLLGYVPAAWHWSLMLIRFLTALVFWGIARCLWPKAHDFSAWLGVLFAVYPIFTLQPLAVAYTLHWTMYLVFMLSVLAMAQAVRRPRWSIPLTGIALLLQAMHLAFIEYFAGLELARPILLWLLLDHLSGRERIKGTLRLAAPYLAVLVLYAVYRSSYAVLFGYDRFGILDVVGELVRSPLATLQAVAQAGIQDLLYIVLMPWGGGVDPAMIDLARPSTYLIVGSSLGIALLAYLAFARVDRTEAAAPEMPKPGAAAMAGLLIVILAMLPFWFTGLSVFQKNLLWSERLALGAMLGAAMLVVGSAFALISGKAHRNLALSVLLGLAVSLHVQTARSYQASWDKQRMFYWQLHWRAPALQANTLIVADQEILYFMGVYPTAFAINMLYPQTTPPPTLSYWFNADSEHLNFDQFASGQQQRFEKYGATFAATVKDVLAITFEPGSGQCLWVLRPELSESRSLTASARTWLEVSNPSRIQIAPDNLPPTEIFGREPEHTWCYYFEKADLAAQFQQWNEILRLWGQATEAGLRAPNAVELLPFIGALGREGRWNDALVLTRQAQVMPDRSTSLLCDAWRDLTVATAGSVERDLAAAQVHEDLGCQQQ